MYTKKTKKIPPSSFWHCLIPVQQFVSEFKIAPAKKFEYGQIGSS